MLVLALSLEVPVAVEAVDGTDLQVEQGLLEVFLELFLPQVVVLEAVLLVELLALQEQQAQPVLTQQQPLGAV